MQCFECLSDKMIKKGFSRHVDGSVYQRYKCTECNSYFTSPISISADDDDDDDNSPDVEKCPPMDFIRDDDWIKENITSMSKVVITCAQNNSDIDADFLKCLRSYVEHNSAGFIVIPILYNTTGCDSIEYSDEIRDFLCGNNVNIDSCNVRIYGDLKISATADNPLSSMDYMSKGYTIITGHPQVQLRTLPNMEKRVADIMTTTGTITKKNYSKTKTGEKANFNHSLSAVILEMDGDSYHIRHLNYSTESKSFYDIDTEYTVSGEVRKSSASALVVGDEHIVFRDSGVEKYTYTDPDSIVNTIQPEYIVRHDSLDAYSISHHHKHNVFTQYAKWKSGMNRIEDELKKTVDYINATTPDYATSLVVQSNHNEHLLRWLNEVDIKTEPWNAKIYHYLMYQMLERTDMGVNGTVHPDPFELVASPFLKPNVKFVNRNGYKIHGIEVGAHGDKGINGARGSASAFSRNPDKMIVGHSHSPAIQKGCYVVGTSSMLHMEYNSGSSTWHHAHVIIHPNGKRQMVFITSNGWRLSPNVNAI